MAMIDLTRSLVQTVCLVSLSDYIKDFIAPASAIPTPSVD